MSSFFVYPVYQTLAPIVGMGGMSPISRNAFVLSGEAWDITCYFFYHSEPESFRDEVQRQVKDPARRTEIERAAKVASKVLSDILQAQDPDLCVSMLTYEEISFFGGGDKKMTDLRNRSLAEISLSYQKFCLEKEALYKTLSKVDRVTILPHILYESLKNNGRLSREQQRWLLSLYANTAILKSIQRDDLTTQLMVSSDETFSLVDCRSGIYKTYVLPSESQDAP